MAPYRVLVVDDSAFMRTIISDLIVRDKQFTIAATASNGMEAIAAVREHQPDVVTMDLEMPQMNGIEALQFIMKDNPRPIIMLSGISEDNTRDTIKALQFGAFDFIRKPSGIGSDDILAVGEQLLEKLRTAAYVKTSKEMLLQRQELASKSEPIIHNERLNPRLDKVQDEARKARQTRAANHSLQKAGLDSSKSKSVKPLDDIGGDVQVTRPAPTSQSSAKRTETAIVEQGGQAAGKPNTKGSKLLDGTRQPAARSAPPLKSEVQPRPAGAFRHLVALGTSTGGPRALHEVICSLPADFPAPVLVVQHMPPKFTKSLAQRLDNFSQLTVVEAEQGMAVQPGKVYIAPGGYHLELAKQDGGYVIRLGLQPQRNGHRPSVDIMFESLASFRELSIHAVIMTGMGSDGAKGMKVLAEQGAVSLIAESEETCVVYGMPRCAIEGGYVKDVLPLGEISSQLVKAVAKN
ncbi:chemotaxis response regulator protein-glutamate methylesterase [Paenibacillus agaridevorans]|uniref:Protein-glutamate methylesterase/protein-glutamine glutaminase n=1 Tax=Paenibacillus agaridevorans TaxID=171404 RepID=A0A2R5F1L4_9BACL|nr:chemotaxis response regulator protein-glutamate methylesterase [Paenibacillus agaridevorans]GBG09614.1 chemotaxis response regulator protein-glutamate methylesterase [Paenibacillus agaridevorans]